ncbi:50S ribosomal protein L29 [Phormidium yuhuli AB48]|uniref:Large ribosomal subunit protein uL29 n=1 Tax=Phormidium yuhuli AB48 TaxID=2940671 RepID=A0ABY5ARQ1_9CYAN|nr:50S ribosomal protein L29 [Phormidium yuhuli]USR91889.1 50S ribosomal protein L29 [Phormidium yuhuli AB48]
MALPQIEEVRNLSQEEIAEQVVQVKKQLFELRLQQATGQLEKTHQFKHLRHRLAQLLTVEGELKRQAASEAAPQADSDTDSEGSTPATPVVEASETPAPSESTTEATPEAPAEEATAEEE